MVETLRLFIRESIEELDELTLSGQNSRDLDMALTWLKNNRRLNSVGKTKKSKGGKHSISAKIKGDSGTAKQLVKDRFGVFVDVD
jgi:hypothetical protein